MLEQAIDFKTESDDLFQIIKTLTDEDLNQKTGFKEWTINNIIGHLHTWNIAADRSLTSDEEFANYVSLFSKSIVKDRKCVILKRHFLRVVKDMI